MSAFIAYKLADIFLKNNTTHLDLSESDKFEDLIKMNDVDIVDKTLLKHWVLGLSSI